MAFYTIDNFANFMLHHEKSVRMLNNIFVYSLHELVNNGKNGYTFKNSNELSNQIVGWFEDFPRNEKQNQIAERMRNELKTFQESRWEDNWNLRAREIFQS